MNIHKCYTGCGRIIEYTNFELCHVIAVHNGGSCNVDNFRPICKTCYSKIGSDNMLDWSFEHYPLTTRFREEWA